MKAAVLVVGAERGTLQLMEQDSLNLVAHYGHERPFLDFFATVISQASVCGEAMKFNRRVIVEDVEESPLFTDTSSLEVLRSAGVRSVQSTPLVNRKGKLIGMLTTQWGVPYVPDDHDLWRIDLLAQLATEFIENKRAEDSLRQNEERLRLAKTAAELGIHDYDILSGTIGWDERVRELWGVDPDLQITYDIFESGLHPDDRDAVRAAVEKALNPKGNGQFETEYRIINRKDNSEHWIFATGKAFFEQDRAIRLIGTVEDITGRKLAETELSEARDNLEIRVEERTAELEKAKESVTAERQRLYDILETMPVMVCLLTPDHHVTFANRSFRERFGEDNGRHCYDYCFGKEEPCEFCESYNVLKTGKPHQWEVKAPDGSIIDVYDFPFADTDGSPLILELDIDITDRKRAEQALREASSYNRSLIEASLDPLFTISTEGKITDANTATEMITGHPREELIGTDFADYFSDPEKARSGYETVFRDGIVKNYELTIRHEDGTFTPVLYNASLYRDDSGKTVGIFAAARDISERKRAQDELIRSNKDLQHFAYVASHDLQEPLRNVATCLQLLEKDYKDKLDPNADQLINYAVDSSVRMKALIEGLLAYSRIATKGKPQEQLDCEQILQRAVTNLSSAITEAEAVITHDPLPTISADDTQLLQVFQNLIGNAIKFRRDDPPRIHVSAVKNRNEWMFSVKDNGIGIESQHLERIFVIFQRLHKRSEYEGTGMGLAIVKKVVERHGGRVWVESEPGVGTTVYFTLPEKGVHT